jgi:hypothetical protein
MIIPKVLLVQIDPTYNESMSNPVPPVQMTITETGMEDRVAAVIAHPGYANRGAWEATREARRQFGFGERGSMVLYWLDDAELLAGIITQQEFNARVDARQSAKNAAQATA